MKKLIIIASIFAMGCTKKEFLTVNDSCSVEGTKIVCADGTNYDLPTYEAPEPVEQPDPIIIEKIKQRFITVGLGKCQKVVDGVYIQNNSNGAEFDVYYNKTCEDSLGEYCNNTKTQNPASLSGKAELCFVNNLEMTAIKNTNKSIKVRILEFE